MAFLLSQMHHALKVPLLCVGKRICPFSRISPAGGRRPQGRGVPSSVVGSEPAAHPSSFFFPPLPSKFVPLHLTGATNWVGKRGKGGSLAFTLKQRSENRHKVYTIFIKCNTSTGILFLFLVSHVKVCIGNPARQPRKGGGGERAFLPLSLQPPMQ